jgi:hypothetical protein
LAWRTNEDFDESIRLFDGALEPQKLAREWKPEPEQ